MLVEEELARAMPERNTALTIGVFDGVHLGHQLLIAKLNERAAANGLASVVVTFQHHPRLVIKPQTHITRLTSLQERIRLLHSLGVEHIVPLSFTPELSQLSAREFVELLKRYQNMHALVVGPDFALGKGRKGNADVLQELGSILDFSVEVVPPAAVNGEMVSSTAIRKALAQGDVAKASRFLGRHFTIAGAVTKGDERGRTLGFPTANIIPEQGQALPADGVYAAQAHLGEARHPAVVNIGLRPTFGSEQRLVEAHLLDFSGNLYGQELKVELVERLRGEVRFSSAEELKAQMTRDVAQAKGLLMRS
jgi:riboflavin kinase/FMN adenylyltransferase